MDIHESMPNEPQKDSGRAKQPFRKLTHFWHPFCNDYADFYNPRHPQGMAIGAYLRRTLRQFRLDRLYDEADILVEVYMRAHRLIQGGVTIANPYAWTKRVAYNVIRELSRKEKRHKHESLEDYHFHDHPMVTPLDVKTDSELLQQAMRTLEPAEQRILELKIIEEYSWEEIQDILAQEGENVSVAALRKRKQRALEKLHQIYHSLRPLTELGE
jgi:RNA polymerase sigma factor (sigma-70 family)